MPWDDIEEMTAWYEERFHAGLPLWATFSYRSAEQHQRRLRWYAERLGELPDVDSVLDVGCGPGELLEYVEPPAGYQGVDVTRCFIDEARRRFPGRRSVCCEVLRDYCAPAQTVVMAGLLGLSPKLLALVERSAQLAEVNLLRRRGSAWLFLDGPGAAVESKVHVKSGASRKTSRPRVPAEDQKPG